MNHMILFTGELVYMLIYIQYPKVRHSEYISCSQELRIFVNYSIVLIFNIDTMAAVLPIYQNNTFVSKNSHNETTIRRLAGYSKCP